MSHVCEFCTRSYATTSSLRNHQKRAMFCLEIQKQQHARKVKIYRCELCNKTFTLKHHLRDHLTAKPHINRELQNQVKELHLQMEAQKQHYEREIKKLKKQIKQRDNAIKTLAERAIDRAGGKTVNKTHQQNLILNMQPITDEHIRNSVQHLQRAHVERGIKGFADFALEYVLKDRIICVDFSRKKLKYKDDEEKVVTDPEMIHLMQRMCDAVYERNELLVQEVIDEIQQKVLKCYRNDDDLKTNLLLSQMDKVTTLRLFVSKGRNREKAEGYSEFLRRVCADSGFKIIEE